MIQSKEYIIHQIANDIKTHIGQKYKNKSNIDWGAIYWSIRFNCFFCFTAARRNYYLNVSCSTASVSGTLTGSVG